MNLNNIPIITYHQIASCDQPADPWHLTVSVRQFERQIRYLYDHGYKCVSLGKIWQAGGENQLFHRKNVVLTFDDGYENFFTLAYPILHRYGFTATVFLITDCVGKRSDREFERGVPFLTWEQVKSLYKDGVSFGSHTCTHPRLPLISRTQIWRELVSSKECIENRLGEKVNLLAYPHGHSNPEIQQMAEAAGYKAAFGISKGRRSRFNLWRTQCHTNDSLLSFIFQLTKWPYHTRHFREETNFGQFVRMVKHKIRQ
jgi:peptidoglycan/xylan/chitin deacetylase (PgdA/CDA1 family)